MEWEKLLNSERLGTTHSTDPNTARSEFDRDADRVIFSASFRRLSRKTQVHPLVVNDHVHTRLTHSIETAQVGRALAKAVFPRIQRDLPKHISAEDLGSILQAACLAHDIGNPPFGHAGERAMVHWFSTKPVLFDYLPEAQQLDIRSFDGNAQGFRVLTQTENHVFTGGLRLTYATLATFLKYPLTPKPGIEKFSAFLSESMILDEVASAVGLPQQQTGYLRHPLAYLVEAADDICYCVLDLEDAVELNIMSFEEVEEILLRPFDLAERQQITSTFERGDMFRVNLARMRGPVFDHLIKAAVEGFLKAYEDIMSDQHTTAVFKQLDEGDGRRKLIEESKTTGRERIYTDHKKVEIELGSFATLDTLLSELLSAARACAHHIGDGSQPSWKHRLVIGLLGDHTPTRDNAPAAGWSEYLCYRRAIDFISGMTDNYATYIAKQMQGMAFSGTQRP